MNFVFDIDGTLCFDGKTINLSIINALNELAHDGHEIIFASARPIRDLVPVLPQHFKSGKLVGGNGCYISENGKVISNFFEPKLLERLTELMKVHQLTYLADGEWDYSFTGNQDHPIYKNIDQSSAKNLALTELSKVCKLVLFNPTETVLDELNQLPVSITSYKSEHAIDISPLGFNKVRGLEKLQIKNFIAFGNDNNDQCMFEKAVYSVCVGDNDVCKYASKSITKDEVAITIKEMSNTLVEAIK